MTDARAREPERAVEERSEQVAHQPEVPALDPAAAAFLGLQAGGNQPVCRLADGGAGDGDRDEVFARAERLGSRCQQHARAERRLEGWFFARYGSRVIEPEIKGAFAALLVLMWLGEQAHSHAVLPAFLLGLAVSRSFERHRATQQRFRVVAFALLTPFFFLRSGMNVSVPLVVANLGLLAILLGIKLVTKAVAVYPAARKPARPHAMFTTLLMSTGLTFGIISASYGYTAGIITQAQFSVLVTVVVLSAVIPTAIAQRFFSPQPAVKHDKQSVSAPRQRPAHEDSRPPGASRPSHRHNFRWLPEHGGARLVTARRRAPTVTTP